MSAIFSSVVLKGFPGAGSNPHGAFAPEDFKSSAYADSPPRPDCMALFNEAQRRERFSGGEGRESNPPATILAAKPVLKTGGATGPLPPPPLFIRYLQRSAQSQARQSAHLLPTFFGNRNFVRAKRAQGVGFAGSTSLTAPSVIYES